MLLRKLFCTLLGIFIYAGLYAQTTVTGTVNDGTTNESLPGATITIKGTSNGTVTDLDGGYKLQAKPEDVLVFSFVGLTSQEVLVGQKTVIDATLEFDVKKLGEVVVIGYGSTSEKLVTGSITQVSAEDLQIAGNAGLDGALQGKAAGVQVTQNSGTPGSAISVLVRGSNSITAGTQPIYVIDGVVMTTGNFGQIGFEGQGINALSDINPSDIESVSVLKDASATAIYGARGGNGVVLITTKSGKTGKTNITLDAYTGVQSLRNKLPLMNAREFTEYLDPNSEIAAQVVNTDWQDEVFRVAPINSVNLSATGGHDRTKFYIGASLFDQEGILIGTDYRRINGRMNLNHEVSKKLSLELKMGITSSENNRVPGDQTINGVLPNAISKPPTHAVRDSSGNYVETGFWDNPVAVGNEAVNIASSFRNLTNAKATWTPITGLALSTQFGLDQYNLDERRYEPTTTRRGANSNGIGISGKTDVRRITQMSTASYQFTLGTATDINFLAGYSFEIENQNWNSIRAINFPSDNLEYLQSAGTNEEFTSGALDKGLNSYFGRLSVNHQNKYLLTLSLRRDGSSQFGPNNQYGNFPGASAAWRISEESFFDAVPVISDLKLRVGYGVTGNDQIPSFRFINAYASGFNYRLNPGTAPSYMPNEDIQWEQTTQYNAGLDVGLLSDRLSLTADLYYKQTNELLLDRPLPGSAGFTTVLANIGSLENKGLELAVSGAVLEGPLKWNTNFNISFNRNKITSLYQDQPITEIGRGNNAVIVGEPVGSFYMYESLGVDPSTGNLVFRDVDFNGVIDGDDRTIVGDPNPEFTGGITNNLSYAGFDFSIFFQFVVGNDIYNGVRQYGENMTNAESDNQFTTVNQRWMKPGDRAPIPKKDGLFNNDITSHYIEDGSFLRLRNVSLGYTIPNKLTSQIGISKLRVYVTGQNLWVLTDYSGYDPEVNYSGISATRAGTDFFTYPQPRTIMGGINLKF